MPRTFRRIALALLCALLIGGLLFAGPGHALLHVDDHGGGHGNPCDACKLVQIEAPVAPIVGGIGEELVACVPAPRELVRTRDVPADARPRAPPRAV